MADSPGLVAGPDEPVTQLQPHANSPRAPRVPPLSRKRSRTPSDDVGREEKRNKLSPEASTPTTDSPHPLAWYKAQKKPGLQSLCNDRKTAYKTRDTKPTLIDKLMEYDKTNFGSGSTKSSTGKKANEEANAGSAARRSRVRSPTVSPISDIDPEDVPVARVNNNSTSGNKSEIAFSNAGAGKHLKENPSHGFEPETGLVKDKAYGIPPALPNSTSTPPGLSKPTSGTLVNHTVGGDRQTDSRTEPNHLTTANYKLTEPKQLLFSIAFKGDGKMKFVAAYSKRPDASGSKGQFSASYSQQARHEVDAAPVPQLGELDEAAHSRDHSDRQNPTVSHGHHQNDATVPVATGSPGTEEDDAEITDEEPFEFPEDAKTTVSNLYPYQIEVDKKAGVYNKYIYERREQDFQRTIEKQADDIISERRMREDDLKLYEQMRKELVGEIKRRQKAEKDLVTENERRITAEKELDATRKALATLKEQMKE